MPNLCDPVRRNLATPVDASSLAVFRITFGVVMLLEGATLLQPDGARLWVESLYVDQVHWLFRWPLFEWLPLWSTPWLKLHCVALTLCGALLAAGAYTRVAAAGTFLAWTYLWLLDETLFNNHYYLASLLALLLVWLPSQRCWSVDRWWAIQQGRLSPTAEVSVPFWSIFILRGQLVVVYFFGGVTKLTSEWLLDAQPMAQFLAQPHVVEWFSAVSPALAEWTGQRWFAFVMAYAGMLYDLLIGPLLLVPRTRLLGLLLTLGFHGLNHFVLFRDIGWFPLMGMSATLIFLDPDWPRQAAALVRARRVPLPDWGWLLAGLLVLPPIGAALGWRLASRQRGVQSAPAERSRLSPVVAALVGLWLAVQCAVPLRHYLIAGPVNWTGEGDRLRWSMKASFKMVANCLVRVEDDQLLGSEQPAAAFDWSAWPSELPRVVYQDVSVAALDWSRLPTILIVCEPLVGERIVFNPYGADAPFPAARSYAADAPSPAVDAPSPADTRADVDVAPGVDVAAETDIDAEASAAAETDVDAEADLAADTGADSGTSVDAPTATTTPSLQEQFIAARTAVFERWQRDYGRHPRVHRLITRREMLAAARQRAESLGAGDDVMAALGQATAAVGTLDSTRYSDRERLAALRQFQRQLTVLSTHPQFGPTFRSLLPHLHPLASQGAAATARHFMGVYDPQLVEFVEGGFLRVRREEWRPPAVPGDHPVPGGRTAPATAATAPIADAAAWNDGSLLTVLVDLDQFQRAQQPVWPLVMVCRDVEGNYSIRWNATADLAPRQLPLMKTNPLLVQRYAQRVAGEWERQFGRRPRVYVENFVSMLPHPFQRNVDPAVDLAGAQRSWWRHNAWIEPLRKVGDEGTIDVDLSLIE